MRAPWRKGERVEPVNPDGAPYAILNFDALWWVIILVTLIVIAAFYILTYTLTKPIEGDPDSIFYRKPSLYRRARFLSELNSNVQQYSSGELTTDETVSELHDLMIRFLQTKTKTNITGYTYAELSVNGAPDDLLEAISQSYHILYSPISDGEKRYRVDELVKVCKKVIMRWR